MSVSWNSIIADWNENDPYFTKKLRFENVRREKKTNKMQQLDVYY